MGYGKSEHSLRYLCLLYMIPWLPNMALFCGKSPEDQAKCKEILRLLIDLTLTGEVKLNWHSHFVFHFFDFLKN
jgi:hypothetical protein